MDSFLESYHLPRDRFCSLLAEYSVLFSGSAALALYLRQEGIGGDVFLPNDMDLWIHSSKDPYVFLDFFLSHGYHLVRSFRQQDQYTERLNHIQRIFTFQHMERGSMIQLIAVNYPHLLDYINDQFDLSVCMTWWNTEDEVFETMFPVLTNNRQMFARRSFLSNVDGRRFEERLQKYIQRGFLVVSEPPPCLYERDRRSEDDMKGAIVSEIKAFDVWLYEEVDGRDHLKESLWNILLRVGENWYSFERKALSTYMEEHRRMHTHFGQWYDTPYRHTLSHDSMTALFYCDFSIYRLIDPCVVHFNGVSKTVYTMEAYSVADWIRGVPTRVYEHGVGVFLSCPMDDRVEDDLVVVDDSVQVVDDSVQVIEENQILSASPILHVSVPFASFSPDIPFLPMEDDILGPFPPLSADDLVLYHQFQEWIQSEM